MTFVPYFTPIWCRLLLLLRLTSRPLVHLHPKSTILNSTRLTKKVKKNLADVLARCPSLTGPTAYFTPTPYLSSGHLSTIFCTIADFSYDKIEYSRQYLKVPDGGTLALDFAPPVTKAAPLDDRPVLVVLHGLTGGSHESYVIDILSKVTKPKSEGGLGWRGVVVNFRGCAGTPVTSPKLYNGGYTDDLRCALSYLSHVIPNSPLHGVGFSLGANVLSKYLGEEGCSTPLTSAAVLGCPWDFVEGHVHLSNGWLKTVYSKAMASNLRRMLWRHREVFEKDKRLDWDGIYGNKNQTLFEFDSLVTAPLSEYPTAYAYYRGVSSRSLAHNIAIPLMSLNALDDPIVAGATVPTALASHNPNLVFVTTEHGGHLGWFGGFFKVRRWISKPVLEWFAGIEEATGGDSESPAEGREVGTQRSKHRELLKGEEEGSWVWKERKEVGFKELESGGVELAEAGVGKEEDGLIKGL